MDNFDLKKYLAEGKLLKENLDFIKDLSKSKIHDVISGDQYFLKYEDGSTFGQTSQQEDHKVFYTRSQKERDLVKQVGKPTIIKMINKYHGLNIEDIL